MQSLESTLFKSAMMQAPKAMGTPIEKMFFTIFIAGSTSSSSSGVSLGSWKPAV